MIEKATGKKAKVFRFKASLKIDSNFALLELTIFDENKKINRFKKYCPWAKQ
jgi:hypothetical protein